MRSLFSGSQFRKNIDQIKINDGFSVLKVDQEFK